jgi:hypothetical protein
MPRRMSTIVEVAPQLIASATLHVDTPGAGFTDITENAVGFVALSSRASSHLGPGRAFTSWSTAAGRTAAKSISSSSAAGSEAVVAAAVVRPTVKRPQEPIEALSPTSRSRLPQSTTRK